MPDAVALVTVAVVLAIAGLHVHWALGGRWPGHDAASLNALVVGARPGASVPSPPLTLTVALALCAVAIGALAVRGLIAVPAPDAVRTLTWVAAAVFAIRGVGGLFATRLRPHLRGMPFARWNLRLYSPLCLLLAVGLTVALVG